MKSLKYIVLITILLISVGSIVAYKMYTKEHEDVQDRKIEFELTADQLLDEFLSQEAEATVKYGDKIISVTGTILEVDLSNELEPQVVLETSDISGYIRCGFEQKELELVKKLTAGNTVKLKGECKGLNASDEMDLIADKDVIVSYCIIIE